MRSFVENLTSVLVGFLLVLLGVIVWVTEALWNHRLEATAAAFGLVGAWLLAMRGEHAAWGWWWFLASNAAWLAFGWIRGHWFLVLQQLGFTASSVLGILTWWAA
jgi:hypothetical protein